MPVQTIHRSMSTLKTAVQANLGSQVISFPGSIALNLNNVMGPATVAFPMIYQSSGWLVPTVLLVAVCIMSAFSATMLCEAMQRIPGNHNFIKRFEFTTTVRHYWGERWYIISQILINICLQCLNIASIIVASQVMDEVLVDFFGKTYGFEYLTGEMRASPFADLREFDNVISAGFILCLLICAPFGLLTLDENMWFQWFSLAALLLSCYMFVCDFLSLPLYSDRVPMIVDTLEGQSQVLGVIVFSYAFVITVPSWVNEKAPSVSTTRVIWYSCFLGLLFQMIIGYLAALAYPDLSGHADILPVMNDSPLGSPSMRRFTRHAVYLFSFGTLIPGIPIYSILVRYNLLMGDVCGPKGAFVGSLVVPWVVSMFLYRGSGFKVLVNWTALLLQGFVNFTIPALLYVSALKRYPNHQDSISASPADGDGLPISAPPADSDGLPQDVTLMAPGSVAADKASVSVSGEAKLPQKPIISAAAQPCLAPSANGDVLTEDTALVTPEYVAIGKAAEKVFGEPMLSQQPKITAVPQSFLRVVCPSECLYSKNLKRRAVGNCVAMTMTSLVAVVVVLDLYYLLYLGKDLVD